MSRYTHAHVHTHHATQALPEALFFVHLDSPPGIQFARDKAPAKAAPGSADPLRPRLAPLTYIGPAASPAPLAAVLLMPGDPGRGCARGWVGPFALKLPFVQLPLVPSQGFLLLSTPVCCPAVPPWYHHLGCNLEGSGHGHRLPTSHRAAPRARAIPMARPCLQHPLLARAEKGQRRGLSWHPCCGTIQPGAWCWCQGTGRGRSVGNRLHVCILPAAGHGAPALSCTVPTCRRHPSCIGHLPPGAAQPGWREPGKQSPDVGPGTANPLRNAPHRMRPSCAPASVRDPGAWSSVQSRARVGGLPGYL